MTYDAGIYVSLRSVNICVVDDDGECAAESKLSSDVQEIIAYLDGLQCRVDLIGLEAGTPAQYLTYGLQAADFYVSGRTFKPTDATGCFRKHSGNSILPGSAAAVRPSQT